MNPATSRKLVRRDDLRDRSRVFADRAEAGEILAAMIAGREPDDAVVLAIPAGGVPVAAAMAERLGLPLGVAVVSKITLPWNTEAGYGAVAFDGTVLVNDALVRAVGLGAEDVERGAAETRRKVQRRRQRLEAGRPMPDLAGRTVLLVDDGLASGFTMRCALLALGGQGAAARVVAVPTAHGEALDRIAGEADRLYCANVRSTMPFAVADAYRRWHDVSEAEAARLLATLPSP
jgi:predicted phosphoribosyltransferase